jgi:hypothetical protein
MRTTLGAAVLLCLVSPALFGRGLTEPQLTPPVDLVDLGPSSLELGALATNGRSVAAVTQHPSRQFLEITFVSEHNEMLRHTMVDPEGAAEVTSPLIASSGDGYLLVYVAADRICYRLFSTAGDDVAKGTLPALDRTSEYAGSLVWHQGSYQLFWAGWNDVWRFRIGNDGRGVDEQWSSVLSHTKTLFTTAEVDRVDHNTLLLVAAEASFCRIAVYCGPPLREARLATVIHGDEPPLPPVQLSHKFDLLRSSTAAPFRLARTTPTIAMDSTNRDLHQIDIVGSDTLASRPLRAATSDSFLRGYFEGPSNFELMFSSPTNAVRIERYSFSGRLLSSSELALPGELALGFISVVRVDENRYALVYAANGRLNLKVIQAGKAGRTRTVQR